MIDISVKLKKLRAVTGKTQKEVAEELKIDERTYRRYELGEVEPTLTNALKLAKYFNVSIEFLTSETD